MKKDLHLKRYLSDKRRFADLINGFAGEGQEKPHYLMPVRCMTYDSMEYERQTVNRRREVKAIKGLPPEEGLSGFRKQDRLMPCVTLALFFGENWDGAKSIHELLEFAEIPKKLRDMVNDYHVHILEIQKISDTNVFRTDVKQVFDAVRCSGDPEKLKELIFNDPVFRNLDIEAYNVIVHYTHARDLFKLREEIKKGEKIDMCQAWATMIEKERNLGKSAGRIEGNAYGILDVLSEHSAVPEDVSNRILSETDLSVLTGWLKLAAKAETLEDFVKKM